MMGPTSNDDDGRMGADIAGLDGRCARLWAWVACCVVGLALVGSAHGRSVAATRSAAVQPVDLRTEYRTEPDGVDTPRPVFGWTLRPLVPTARGLRQTAYRLRVATSPQGLRAGGADRVWDSGRLAAASYWQESHAGPPLAPHRRYWWQVQAWTGGASPGPWSRPAQFTTALLDGFDPSAHWIAAEPDGPPSRQALEADAGQRLAEPPPPLPVFRRAFDVDRPLAEALLHVSGLGQADVHVNGRPATDAVLQPGWTDYRKTVLYGTYPVARLLHPGRNMLAVLLGNGMYNVQGVAGRYTKFVGSYGQPKVLVQLELRYRDGGTARIVSDASWQTRDGPVRYASIYGGEDHDARVLPADWDRRGGDGPVNGLATGPSPAPWRPALEVAGPGGALAADRTAPMAVVRRLPAVRLSTDPGGSATYDIGRTVSGWPRITVQGPAGSRVSLLPGELLDAGGRVTQRSVNATPASAVLYSYVLRGGGPETWHPHFSYTSWRYVQVDTAAAPGSAALPRVVSVGGEMVHARVPDAGRVASADPLHGRIHRLIDAAVVSNLASIVTDCPSREKLGWLEQTHLNAATLMWNHDVTPLYEKLADDLRDAQQPDGLVPSIAPEYVAFVDGNGRSTAFRTSPEWGSAIILSPWALYRATGDDRPLRRLYPAMRRYMAYLAARAPHDLLDGGLGDWYDLGPGPPGASQLTDPRLTATAVALQDWQTLDRIATLLGHPDDAAHDAAEAARVREAYNAAWFDPAHDRYDRGSQTAAAMSLVLGIVPAEHVAGVRRALVDDIAAHGDHVTTGDIGWHYLVDALIDAERPDVMARLLARRDPPSYGAQLARGATTLTEAWDADPASSQNHFMLGNADDWFYRGLVGLSFDMADGAEAAIRLRPSLLPGVAWAHAWYRSPLGRVALGWRRGTVETIVDATVPAGAVARIELDAACRWIETSMSATPQARPASQVLGSGRYTFRSRSPACLSRR